MVDAVVIGAGPNGLCAGNILAERGWEVLVLEEQDEPGGAVRTEELTRPGFRHDVFSSFYPLAAVSPVLQGFELESHGLRWRQPELPLAHPLGDACAAISRDLDETAASFDSLAPGDGDAWRELYGFWLRAAPRLLDALFAPFPPIVPAARLLARLGPHDALELARVLLVTARRLGEERFAGVGGPLLLAGNGLHADLAPDSAAGAAFGLLLCALAQQHGFPAPEGGAGQLTRALVRRLRSVGGALRCGERAVRVVVRGGRAAAVRTATGEEVAARRAVLADVGAPQLYGELVGTEHLPARLLAELRRFQYDASTVKVDWALSAPIPWRCEEVRRAGTVHVGEGMDGLTLAAAHIQMKLVPARPFLVMGQYASFDPTRAPAGADTAWAYAHVPQVVRGDAGGEGIGGGWDERDAARFADRVEREVEREAPGFRELILDRHVLTPPAMEARNRNLVGGALNGGTAQLHQQAVFRPVIGLGRPETPVRGLYLASASAHPGGAVHGAPGANAAQAALLWSRAGRLLRRR